MIERRQIDHLDLLQLGKTLLLLAKRQELLVGLPATSQPASEIVPTEELSGRSWARHDFQWFK